MSYNNSKKILGIAICVIIVGISISLSIYMMKTKPKPKMSKPIKKTPVVEITHAVFADYNANIKTIGKVIPDKIIDLKSLVAGEVSWINPEFTPGGKIERGETILKIDTEDMILAIKTKEMELEKADYELLLEKGRQDIAAKEFEMLSESINAKEKDLILRKPQLKVAQASFKAAQASLQKAKLDLSRCNIKAPFDSIVISKNVDKGSYIAQSTSIASIAGMEKYKIEVSIPKDRLGKIIIPNTDKKKGSLVRIYDEAAWGGKAFRTGYVKRLIPEIEEGTLMAQIIVEISDPLCIKCEDNKKNTLILNSYVKVEIEGKDIKDVMRISRDFVHDNNKIYVLSPENELEIREASIIWQDRDFFYIKDGIGNNEIIITTDLASPVDGMRLRLFSEKSETE